MKKFSSVYVLIIIILFTGCVKKTDSIFDKTVDERLNEALTNYLNALTSAPGWKLYVYPKGLENQGIKVGGFTYYLKFANNNRVTMVSDFLTSVAAIPKESGYRLKALQRPSLIFDTYSYMHIPADPDPDVSFSPTGAPGTGWGTDFNFAFTDVAIRDTFILKGNFNHSDAVLVKATQAEMDAAFTKSRLRDILNLSSDYLFANPYLYFQASSSLRAGFGFDLTNKIITFSYVQGSNLVNQSVAFSFTTYGIHLAAPTTVGNYTFSDIYWDDTKKIYYILSGTTHIEFANAASSLVTISLTNIIGNQYTVITVPPSASTPNGTTLPNESPLFLSRYNTAKAKIMAGAYGLTLDEMDFVFDAASKTMNLYILLYQGTDGPFVAQSVYSYTADASGYFKFTKTAQNTNAALIATDMSVLLGSIETDQFKLDGFSTSFSFLGQFTSRQTPAFYFSGYLY